MSFRGGSIPPEITKCPFCKSDNTRPTEHPYTGCLCCRAIYNRYTGVEADEDGYQQVNLFECLVATGGLGTRPLKKTTTTYSFS